MTIFHAIKSSVKGNIRSWIYLSHLISLLATLVFLMSTGLLIADLISSGLVVSSIVHGLISILAVCIFVCRLHDGRSADRKAAADDRSRDPLTGLFNRHYFIEQLSRLDSPDNLPLSIIVADINGLKMTNDAFNQQTGDYLLKTVANLLRQSCRGDDLVARIGGDEFSIFLPRAGTEQAEIVCRRIHKAAKAAAFDSVVVSLSLGFSVKSDIRESIRDALTRAEDNMQKEKIRCGRKMKSQFLEAVIYNLNCKYENEQVHTERVSQYSEAIAAALNLPENEINDLKKAGALHDIGKVMIPTEILNKPGKLTPQEMELVRKHPVNGAQILKAIDEFAYLADYVRHHHERWDGKGYPAGLKAAQTPLFARILAVADAYEAMTAYRAYQAAKSKDEAIMELRACAGTQFDPDLVEIFIENVLENSEKKVRSQRLHIY